MTWDQAGIGGFFVILVALCAVRKAGRLKSESRKLKDIIAADHFSLTVQLHTRWITATERSCLNSYVLKKWTKQIFLIEDCLGDVQRSSALSPSLLKLAVLHCRRHLVKIFRADNFLD